MLRTTRPASIKAKMTELEKAAMAYAWRGAAHPEDVDALEENVQIARYNLEKAVRSYVTKATNQGKETPND